MLQAPSQSSQGPNCTCVLPTQSLARGVIENPCPLVDLQDHSLAFWCFVGPFSRLSFVASDCAGAELNFTKKSNFYVVLEPLGASAEISSITNAAGRGPRSFGAANADCYSVGVTLAGRVMRRPREPRWEPG